MSTPSKSHISWTDATWSPVTGCTKVSQGCKNCYAEREVESRWSKNPKSVFYGRSFGDVQCHLDKIEQPLHWKKPKKIFVCPRGDLFHDAVPDRFIADAFGVMATARQHTFQVLTKRPERMMKLLSSNEFTEAVVECLALYSDGPLQWPLPNVWIGVSVEDQQTVDERIPFLLRTPAAVRWISAEPLLGPVTFRWAKWHDYSYRAPGIVHGHLDGMREIDWVVGGGESGPDARPMRPDWVRALRDQCKGAGVPFNFKQWGEWGPAPEIIDANGSLFHRFDDGTWMQRYGVKSTGRLLDGALHDEYPGRAA